MMSLRGWLNRVVSSFRRPDMNVIALTTAIAVAAGILCSALLRFSPASCRRRRQRALIQ